MTQASRRCRLSNGIKANDVLPLAIEQTRFDWGEEGGPDELRYDNAVLFGLDPQRALAGDDPFLKLRFIEGDPDVVATELAAGGACVISEDFQMLTGIGTGDELSFTPPNAPHEKVTYRVSGVVFVAGMALDYQVSPVYVDISSEPPP